MEFLLETSENLKFSLKKRRVSVFCALQQFDFAHFENFIANLDFLTHAAKVLLFRNLNFHNFRDAKIRTLEILNFRDIHGAKKLIFCDSSSENKSFAIAIISIRFVNFFSLKKIFLTKNFFATWGKSRK